MLSNSKIDDSHTDYNCVINGKKQNLTNWQIEYFWRIEFKKCLEAVSPGFVIDATNRVLVAELYKYAWSFFKRRYESEIFPSSKGILFYGPIGVGKTTLCRALQMYFARINAYAFGSNNKTCGIQYVSATEIAMLYADKGIDGITKYISREKATNLIIDEIGREGSGGLVKHYGTEMNVIQTILQLRYELRDMFITIGTTNIDMSTNEFSSLYGPYVADRVRELFTVCEVTGDNGKSRRK